MADSTSFNLEVLQAVDPAKAPKNESSPASRAGRFFTWLLLSVVAAIAVVPMISLANEEARTMTLLAASDDEVRNLLATEGAAVGSPDYLETLSELSLEIPKPDLASAEAAARKAVQLDPSRAHVWARLAWLETQKVGGKVNEASLDALGRSMDACPLCSQELIAWRFNFVLANWASMPEPMRRRAFEHADLLRWIGPNAEFLAEMRVKAKQNGIPFDDYRAAVETPVRTWDIMAGRAPTGA
jgi:hypothetical protein